MNRKRTQPPADPFEMVRTVGLELPEVEETTKAGSRVLTLRGVFLAGLATHPSAEPNTLVVRSALEEREWLLEDAPETYYLTDFYRRYPLVLVRLSRIDRDALRDVLSVSWRLTAAKTRKRTPRPLHDCRTLGRENLAAAALQLKVRAPVSAGSFTRGR